MEPELYEIMPHWAEMILTIMASVLASSGFWAYIQTKREKKDAKTQLLIGLAHDRILSSGQYYLDQGFITADEFENIYNYLYLPYKELGGNGSAERMVEKIKKLPMSHPKEES